MLALRATSPKPPKPKPLTMQRSGSPLAGSRATSPVPTDGSRAASPQLSGDGPKPNNKRKADDASSGPASPGGPIPAPKLKKRKPAEVGQFEDQMLIDWLRATPDATTRACIQHFTPYLRSPGMKEKFTALVKEVATMKKDVLVLRKQYRGDSAAPSPAPATPV
jgi:transcription initiation factor TFIIF subunit alpha